MMKKLIDLKIFICIVILSMSITSCEKFSLLKNEKVASPVAGTNLQNKTIWEFISENNFHANDATNIGLFGKAVEHAGLKDLLDDPKQNLTVIIPNDAVLLNFITGLGYSTVEEVPAVILKNIILNDVIQGRVRSFDLEAGVSKSYPSLSNDSLYLTRTVTNTDQYVLIVNSSPNASSVSTGVRTQNLEFINGVAHVSNSFTYYTAKTNKADTTKVPVSYDTIFVSKDTYLWNGNANKNLNFGSALDVQTKLYDATGGNASYSKRTYTQYAVRRPNFNGRIGTAKLEIYFNKIDGAASMNFFEVDNVDWNENTITFVNAPAMGTVPIGNIPVKGALINKWSSIDLTSFYTAGLAQGKTFVNIGGGIVENTNINFRSKEFNGGVFRSRIVLSSAPLAIIRPAVNNPINVQLSNPVKAISLNELKFDGTADKNISYTLTVAPQNGFLVLNGIPLAVNSSFTQEQVAKGVVKYLYNGTVPKTDALTLEARDFQGGIYDSPINMTVNIQ
nr:DNRLRE domain-containing protein [uncultured Pedobacter sp.]